MGVNNSKLKRIQVQLYPSQSEKLKVMAKERGVSVSELIRKGVDFVIKRGIDWEEKKRKAMEIVGKFSSDKRDVSEEHDRYLCFDRDFEEEGFRILS